MSALVRLHGQWRHHVELLKFNQARLYVPTSVYNFLLFSRSDSWSSETSYPQTNATTWVKKELEEETESGSPNGSEHVSSSYPENTSLQILGSEDNAPQSLPLPLPEKADKDAPKQKARTAFSTGQMDALTHRFNMQRYLSPAEMKALAGLTGLTYKQVSCLINLLLWA